MSNQSLSWVNGLPSTCINTADRGFAYGHGVFETLRVQAGAIPLQKLHWQRLLLGCSTLQIPIDTSLLQGYIDQALAANPYQQALLKLTVTAGVAKRGYAALIEAPTYLIQLSQAPALDWSKSQRGVALYSCQHRLPQNVPLAGLKHLNRLDQVLAAMEFDPADYDEGLILDDQGSVIEAVSRNLFCKTPGGWVTPLLEQSGVKGVMREYLLHNVFPSLNMPVSEQALSIETLLQSSEVLLCNSVTGIWPVVSLGGKQHWVIGDDTRHLIQQLGELQACFRD